MCWGSLWWINFSAIGNFNNLLEKGYLYGGTADDDAKNIKAVDIEGAFTSGLDDIIGGYTLFDNAEETDVDFILMGSAAYPMEHARALAQKVIAVAEGRQDCVAFVSPYREAFLNETTDGTKPTVNEIDTITENVVKFYSPVTSSSYGVLDSGYKYMYDRFNNTFRYIPLNGDQLLITVESLIMLKRTIQQWSKMAWAVPRMWMPGKNRDWKSVV